LCCCSGIYGSLLVPLRTAGRPRPIGCGARMHPLRAKYLASETALSMAINAAISIGFAWLVFHGHDHVPSSGPGGLVRDAAPQTFMITLMSTLVPSLVTRKRMHSGHLDAWLRGQLGGSPAPAGKIVLRALMLALIGRCPSAAVPRRPCLQQGICLESRIRCPGRTGYYTIGNFLGVERISFPRLRAGRLYTLHSALIPWLSSGKRYLSVPLQHW
jgi:hypothetical protein